MSLFKPLFPLAALATLASCTTLKDSLTLGIGVGSVVGGAVGAAAGKADGNELRSGAVGAAAGAAIGGLAGYLSHKENEKKGKLLKISGGTPSTEAPELSTPTVRRVWIPDKIEDGVYTVGHYSYIIESPATWKQKD